MARWTAEADGWEFRSFRHGGGEHRLLITDAGRPRFGGSAKRYAYVYDLSDGTVHGRSEHGYQRQFASVAEAKAYLGESRHTGSAST